MSAMAFLAGMGAGYLGAKDKNREQERQDAKDQREQSMFDVVMAEKKKAQEDRDALRSAGQDAVVTPEQGPPTEAMVAATPDGQEPANIGYLAGNGTSARHFASQGLADAAATQMNSLDGKFSRQQAAMQGVGDYAGAQKLQLDNMTLKKHASDLIKEGTGDALSAAVGGQSPEEVKAIYNQNGGKKVRDITITPFDVDHPVLGKQRSAKIRGTFEDGSPLNVPDAYQMNQQLLGVAKKFDLDTKWAEIGNKKTHDDGTLAVAQQNANTMEQYRKDMAAASFARAGAGQPIAETAFNPLGNFDGKKANAVALEQAAKEAESRAGAGKPMTPMEQGALAQQLYRGAEDAFAAENTNRHVSSVVGSELRSVMGNPNEYAATYAKALKLGLNDKKLTTMGFQPPTAKAAPTKDAPVPNPADKVGASAIAAQGVHATTPTYENWMAAKNAKEELIKTASRMSPDRRESYLQSRLPQVEQAIKFNWNYKTN